MKKLLISLLLSSSALFATSMTMANTKFSAPQMAQIQLSALTFKDVMRQFYSGQLTSVYLRDKDLIKMPHVGLGPVDKDDTRTVAVMHPVMTYKNSTLEPRYLVIIEKVQTRAGWAGGGCHSCGASVDLYTFKKTKKGLFQLISRNNQDVGFSGRWGRIVIDLKRISESIQPLGNNLVGSIIKNSFTNVGETVAWWEVLHLPENDFVGVYKIADAGGDNSGNHDESSPLYFSYKGTLKVINNGSTYYPIKVTYVGEKPTEDYEQIHQVNYSQTVSFDPIKKEYK